MLENLYLALNTYSVVDTENYKNYSIVGIPFIHVYKTLNTYRILVDSALVPPPVFICLNHDTPTAKKSVEAWGSYPIVSLGELYLVLDVHFSLCRSRLGKKGGQSYKRMQKH